MRLQDDLDFTTLNWVKQELDETLKQARQALEAYVEDPADSSLMRFCATYLHQVQGTLRMVELYGAAMVVEEMERVAQALLDGQIAETDDAYAVLMRGIVQLPDYLERLQGGHKDIPIVLLPLLNDLRGARGEKLLSESVLFSPELSAALPRSAAGPERALPESELKGAAARLRTGFQTSLLQWIKDQAPTEALKSMMGTLERLRAITAQEEARRLWWVAEGVIDAILAGGVEPSGAMKQMFGKVDLEMRRLAEDGEATFRIDAPRELTKNLLYFVAHSTVITDRVRELKATYGLQDLLPTARELEHAKGTLAGKNRALLDTVSQAIKEDLLRVKDALDLYLRTQDARPEGLAQQTEVLDRVGDTLGMLGLGVPRRVVQEQRALLQSVASGARAADEGTLLDVAGALLYVEALLDENIASLGAGSDAPAAGAEASDADLPQAEVRKILDALMKEAQNNLAQAKQDVVAFVESPWDHAKVTQIPRLLEEIGGALRMLDLPEPADLVGALVRFVEIELLELRRVPTAEQMDKLADTLASIEYYLEAARDQRAGRDRILDVTRASLESLGYWPVPSGSELADIAGVALEGAARDEPAVEGVAAPVAAAPVEAPARPERAAPPAVAPEPDFSAMEVDLDAVTFDTETSSPATSFADRLEPETAGQVSAVDMPSEDLGDYIARMDRGEPAAAPEQAGLSASEPVAHPELTSAVEIAPGRDVEHLIVGESAAEALSPPPPPADIAGLRFAEGGTRMPEPAAAGESDDDYDWFDVEEVVEIDAPAARVADASFQAVPSDDIDDEIREVFVEEVQDEIDNIGRQLPAWRRDTGDLDKLKAVRRSFHTLKGSGRLVGALALGEFSWKVENMLNRVLDRTIKPGPAVSALLDYAVDTLPELLAALRGQGAPTRDIAQIMAVADRVAAGEDAYMRAAERIKVTQTRRVRVPKVRPAAAAPELTQAVDITSPFETADARGEDALAAPLAGADEMVELGLQIPALDPMLLEILRSEVEGHLATVREYLGACAIAGAPQPAPEALLRAVHTMHGAISMADVPVVGEIVGPLEGYIKRVRGSGAAPSMEGLEAIHAATELIEDVVTRLDQPGAHVSGSGTLVDQLAALRDSLPEPESPFQVFDLALEDELAAVGMEPGEFVLDLDAAATEPAAPVPAREEAFDIANEDVAVDLSEPRVPQIAEFEESVEWTALPEEAEAVAPGTDELLLPTAEPLELQELEASLAAAEVEGLETAGAGFEPGAEGEEPEAYVATPAEDAGALPPFLAADGGLEAVVPEQEPEPASFGAPEEFGELEALESAQLAAEIDAALAAASALADEAEPAREAEDHVQVAATAGESEETAVPEPSFAGHDALIEIVATPAPEPERQPQEEVAEATSEATADEHQQAWDALLKASEEAEAEAAEEAFFEEDAALEPETVAAFDAEEVEVFEATEGASVEIPETLAQEAPFEFAPEPLEAAAEPTEQERAETRILQEAAYARDTSKVFEDPDPEGPLLLQDMDDDLIEIFVEEGNEILDRADAQVAQLRESTSDTVAIGGLLRHLHTMKGNARAVGLAPVGDLSHAMESLLEAVASERVVLNRQGVASLERGFDLLHRMVARVARRQALGMPVNTIARLEALCQGEVEELDTTEQAFAETRAEFADTLAEAPIAAEAEVAEAAEAAEPMQPVRRRTRPEAKPLVAPEALVEEEAALRAPQEMIRVRSDLLDRLVNLAGEVSIYRSRLEQQMGSFKFNLVELDQTTLRLRDQLRKLEIETEAQIIARFQREAEASHSGFDPLELDRFSTLQQYSRALAESVSDLISLQNALDDLTRQAETLLLQQSRVSSELQEGLMRTRMVPFDSVVPFLRRLLRQTSDELGKRAALRIEGAQGEMDRNLLERMKAPFEHMLRNALAHGIETPAERIAAGKPEEGQVKIVVSREATEVVLRVSDDGKGMDRDRIREKAIERGRMRPDAQLSDRDLFGFVVETGFSTVDTVTKIAGRGVGMDVVASEIKQLGGSLAIDSQRGQGTQFSIRLPFTLAVTQAILVRLGDSQFAIPMSSVQGVARIQREEFDKRIASPQPVLSYAGEDYVIHELNVLLGVVQHRAVEVPQLPLLLIRSGDSRAAIRVDAVLGSREVVVKSVGPQISSVPGILGATIMGDGSVLMILDLAPLVRHATALRAEIAAEAPYEVAAPVPVVEERRRPLVMVVDDSITMRKVTSRVLERNDMEVVTAKDGLDAVEKLQERVPDIMLLDIEMPRMDGYELATYMRNDSRLRNIPIIMITSRTGEKHRQRALEIGIERYLGKPYQELDLLRNVDEVLRSLRAVH